MFVAVSVQALARLYYRDGAWRGLLSEWWGTRPDTTGPYYDPVAWSESPRILSVLRGAMAAPSTSLTEAERTRLMLDLERNRLLPSGGGALIAALSAAKDPALAQVSDGLLGSSRLEVDAARAASLGRLAQQPGYRAAVVKMLAASTVTPDAGNVLRQAAIDPTTDPATRATALTALATATGNGSLDRAIDGFASLNVAAPGLAPELDRAWRQYSRLARARAAHRSLPPADAGARSAKADPRLRGARATRRRSSCCCRPWRPRWPWRSGRH